jgi:zinc D-Ala-D-Ala carboxypeptidase
MRHSWFIILLSIFSGVSMKSHRVTQVLGFILLACVVAFAGAGSNKRNRTQDKPREQSIGASESANGIRKMSEAVKVTPLANARVVPPARFEEAASRNAQLQASLEWSFGSKTQRGWSLYIPLVANLIGSDGNDAAGPFAARLSLWQKENSIEPTGVLDAVTWSRMVSTFQSRRLSNRTYTTPNQLITIPVSDCYDPTRAEELRKAEPETFAAYKRMIAAAIADRSLGLQVAGNGQLASSEQFFKIVSAFRSREYQDQLRRQSPSSGRAGLAINSPHATGRALDLYVGGEPVDTKDENRAIQTGTPVYRWLVSNAGRFGFRPYFYEPWHWEYVGVGSNEAK